MASSARTIWFVVRMLATAFLISDALETVLSPDRYTGVGKYVYLLSSLACIALCWAPMAGGVLAGVALLITCVISGYGGEANVLFLAAIVLIPRLERRWLSPVVSALGVFGILIPVLHRKPDMWSLALANWLLLLVGSGAGFAARGFQAQHQEGQERIAQLERENAEIRAEERTALARELHDVVAHQLSIISLQIMGHRDADDPEELRGALDRVDDAARAALGELQVLVRVLRDDDADAGHMGRLAEVPVPSVLVQQLLQTLEDNDFTVEIDFPSGVDRLERSLQLTLVRVLQEAVTNILRHADPGSKVLVRVSVSPDLVDAVISSAMPRQGRVAPLADLSMGFGLRGLRERVSLTGGGLVLGPSEGRWVVHASLPRDHSRLEDLDRGPTAGAA